MRKTTFYGWAILFCWSIIFFWMGIVHFEAFHRELFIGVILVTSFLAVGLFARIYSRDRQE